MMDTILSYIPFVMIGGGAIVAVIFGVRLFIIVWYMFDDVDDDDIDNDNR